MRKANITLNDTDIDELRKAIVAKYADTTGTTVENQKKTFNSNIKNYKVLYDEINCYGALELIGITSPKPLLNFFYTSRKKPIPKTFKKKFIDELYKYAHGFSRDSFSSNLVNILDQYKKIDGYWQCYYSKDNFFPMILESSENAYLSVVAVTIKSEIVNKSAIRHTVRYFQNENWGKGSLEIQGSNLIFQLRSEKNNEPTYLIMNCGRYIQDTIGHIRHAAGICLYITDSGSPKYAKCMMEYFDEKRVESEFGALEIDLTTEDFKRKFPKKLEIKAAHKTDKRLSQIISFFSHKHLTSDVNIADLTSVD